MATFTPPTDRPPEGRPPRRGRAGRAQRRRGVPPRRGPALAGLALMTVVVAAIAVWGAATGSGRRVAHRPTGSGAARSAPASRPAPAVRPVRIQARLVIEPGAPSIRIPRSFLGFSTEYWTLPVDERHIALYRRVIALVHVPGDGRFVLRIGGDSSDQALWEPARRLRDKPWAFPLTPRWIRRTARVVRENHLRVIIDLNAITGNARLAAAWAREAEHEFPRHSIIGFEIGNEPDLYARSAFTTHLHRKAIDLGRLPLAITPASYASTYQVYARALARVAPHVPLLGPALAEPSVDSLWIATLIDGPHPRLGAITVHEYPYSACDRPGSSDYPSVAKLLSTHAVAQMAAAVAPAVRLAHSAGIPVRVTELNSVTCSGVRGISNTFATALWAPGALFELARAGVLAADLHVRVYSINAPFRFDVDGLRARPLLYGLILFARMLGPHSSLVRLRLDASSSLRLEAWAVREGRRTLNVLLIDKGRRSVNVRLRLPATGPARIQRLLAPSASSTGHVTLDGQRLNDDVRWTGHRVIQTVPRVAGRYTVPVRGMSAALVTVRSDTGAAAPGR